MLLISCTAVRADGGECVIKGLRVGFRHVARQDVHPPHAPSIQPLARNDITRSAVFNRLGDQCGGETLLGPEAVNPMCDFGGLPHSLGHERESSQAQVRDGRYYRLAGPRSKGGSRDRHIQGTAMV